MSLGRFVIPEPVNEPVRSYAPGSVEAQSLLHTIEQLKSHAFDIHSVINGQSIETGNTFSFTGPSDHKHVLANVHQVGGQHIHDAINTALAAREKWANMHWEERAAIFLKAADLLAGPYRDFINASTMLGQGKNAHQAEIDAACEMIDFLRFNVKYMEEIYDEQPYYSPYGTWNRQEQRPLEGFVFAVTPFNFTAIAGNLPTSVAMMGNVVLWKPARTQVYSAYFLMRLFQEAGVPDGVINMVIGSGREIGDIVFAHPDFSGVHFTGSTEVFQGFWQTIGSNITKYKSYPRIVGETGGKDFVVAHPSADKAALATGLVRGAFEFQGQKCSAASRAYIPTTIWDDVKNEMVTQLDEMKMGPVWDFKNFINPVIDKAAFDKITEYIEFARSADDAEIIYGGEYDDSVGYFIKPTVVLTTNPHFKTMEEEIFGPVLTIYVYDADMDWNELLTLVDSTSPYALTGAVFSQDRYAIQTAVTRLRQAAGNFYVNDKPTGAVVGQQPFGGSRASGTNDKAGSKLNLLRWVSPRSIKETFVPPIHFGYPFHQ